MRAGLLADFHKLSPPLDAASPHDKKTAKG